MRISRCGVTSTLRISLVAVFVILVSHFSVQAQSPSEPQRQIKVAVRPEYSPLAKHLNLTGVVRVQVQIAPDGKVKKAHVIGGHPVLGLEAEKAALGTEFEPAPHESTQVIEFRFGASN